MMKRFIAIFALMIPFSVLAAETPIEKIVQLEKASGGRIGIAAINTENNQHIRYRADERFPFCSTFKVMGVGAILKKSMNDPTLLTQKIHYAKSEIVEYSPITEKTQMMSIADLSEATMTYSDNTAMNLLLTNLGGVDAVNSFARSIGDNKFNLTRWEPKLNTAIPGEIRDTTTPNAMQNSLQKLVLGSALATKQRELLQTWLKKNTTGDTRIRASVPKDWIVGDKTGTGDYGTTNDIAVIWPQNAKPIVMAIYFTQNKKDAAPKSDVIAAATKIVLDGIQ